MKKTRWFAHKYTWELVILVGTYLMIVLEHFWVQRGTDCSNFWNETFHEVIFSGVWLPFFLFCHIFSQKQMFESQCLIRIGCISKIVKKSAKKTIWFALWYAICIESAFVCIMQIGNPQIWQQSYISELFPHFLFQILGWSVFGIWETICFMFTKKILFTVCVLEVAVSGWNLSQYLGMEWSTAVWVRPLDLMFRLPEIENKMAGWSTVGWLFFLFLSGIYLLYIQLKKR